MTAYCRGQSTAIVRRETDTVSINIAEREGENCDYSTQPEPTVHHIDIKVPDNDPWCIMTLDSEDRIVTEIQFESTAITAQDGLPPIFIHLTFLNPSSSILVWFSTEQDGKMGELAMSMPSVTPAFTRRFL